MVTFTEYGIVIKFERGFLDGIKDGYQSSFGALTELLNDEGFGFFNNDSVVGIGKYTFINNENEWAYDFTDNDVLALERGCRIAIEHRDMTEEERKIYYSSEPDVNYKNETDLEDVAIELCNMASTEFYPTEESDYSESVDRIKNVLYYLDGKAESDPAFKTFMDMLKELTK